MSRYFCHEHPDDLTLATSVVDARPGAVLLAQTPFYPGGGGQLPDRGTIRWKGGSVTVCGFEAGTGGIWHFLAESATLFGDVEVEVEPQFRQFMRELHTDLHIVNALVYRQFEGALVTGVQMHEDGTARIDFDLPDADNQLLRALESKVNAVIERDLPVSDCYIPLAAAQEEKGLLRSRSVAPPPAADGTIRVVEITGFDRQACGGTHLSSTGRSRPLRILKIDNKGRHNRRIRIGLVQQ